MLFDLLFPLLMLSFGTQLLQPCIPILISKKPALTSNTLKIITMVLLYQFILSLLLASLFLGVTAYGRTLGAITFGSKLFYLSLSILVIATVLMVISSRSLYQKDLTSCTLAGIPIQYLRPTLYKALDNLGLHYQENLCQITLPDLAIAIEVRLSDHAICFRVAQPIDKILLKRLCRAYQDQYAADAVPLLKNRSIMAGLTGIACILGSVFLMVNWAATHFSH
ncbi:hypothetical protein CEK71_14310 [Methylovulum psychrotolerans]|uniref:Uncharacterized protein n=2 Tax=Methylovulum psychrotolerans TaxID=1704499 RepID=A0A1Z4C0T3_9GAMM|nr:hypothetical protein CEK71_14310 [Methylovulum psychrotolerans]